MPYTDPATVRLVLSSVNAETGGTAADLSDDQIQFEIDSAASVIDSYLRVKYNIPFTDPVPQVINTICTDIAAYRSDINYRKSRVYDSQNMPIIQRYNMAMSWLQDLQKGVQSLDTSLRTDTALEGALVVHQYDDALLDWCDINELWPRW